MTRNLIQIGNSKAIIIPAKLIRKRGYDANTEFTIIETEDGLKLVHKKALAFPRLSARPALSDEVRSLCGVVSFSQKELEEDDRLKYLLSR